jgi:hypothetical protein
VRTGVIAGLDQAIHPFREVLDARDTSAFTRVFDALCPAMTTIDKERYFFPRSFTCTFFSRVKRSSSSMHSSRPMPDCL